MTNLLPRHLAPEVSRLSQYFPAVGIIGPRQVGKTTLARMVTEKWERPVLFLDLEDPEHFASLRQPMLFLERYSDHTVVLDEVQRMPEIFPVLRVLIDRDRQPGRFILLGSAAPELVRQSSETLAGRIAYVELSPLTLDEAGAEIGYEKHWLRGGFPGSLLAPDDAFSFDWRKNFVRTYLERDLPQLGISADPVLVGQFWTMLAHLSAGLANREKLVTSLSLHTQTVQKYLHLFEAAFLVRSVFPFIPNVPKRLVKTPKIYLRDTGILHYLLAIPGWQALLGHPSLGNSWETYVVNQVAALLPAGYEMYFYRTHSGAEADLVLAKGGVPEIMAEIKFSTSPVLSKGFHISRQDLQTQRHFVICPVKKPFPLQQEIEVIGLRNLEKMFD
ncbi:MAG: ATP-binding protein [Bacteroidota bacterium]